MKITRILLATEHTEFDAGAEALAMALAQRLGSALPVILPVLSNAEFEAVAPELAAKADAEAARRSAALRAAAGELALELRVRRGGEPDLEIIDEAKRLGTELLITRRRGKRGFLAKMLVGEMVSKILAQAPCDMLIVPREARLWQRGVLAGLDPQVPDPALVDRAAAIARDWGLPLTLVAVAEADSDVSAAQQVIDAARTQASVAGLKLRAEVRRGRVHEALREALHAAGADLLLLGHPRGRMGHPWASGAAEKTIGILDCPVWVCQGPRGEGAP